MKEIQRAYRCEYCGKLYLLKGACATHEKRCLRNPQNRPLCYDCKHYKISMLENADEKITYYEDYGCREVARYKMFSPNRCDALNVKLFNNIKLSDDIAVALYEEDYEAMPLPKDGCERFEKTLWAKGNL